MVLAKNRILGYLCCTSTGLPAMIKITMIYPLIPVLSGEIVPVTPSFIVYCHLNYPRPSTICWPWCSVGRATISSGGYGFESHCPLWSKNFLSPCGSVIRCLHSPSTKFPNLNHCTCRKDSWFEDSPFYGKIPDSAKIPRFKLRFLLKDSPCQNVNNILHYLNISKQDPYLVLGWEQ